MQYLTVKPCMYGTRGVGWPKSHIFNDEHADDKIASEITEDFFPKNSLRPFFRKLISRHRLFNYKALVEKMRRSNDKKPLDPRLVRKFLVCVSFRVIPTELLGGKRNRRKFLTFVRKIPYKSVNEKINLLLFVRDSDFDDITWLSRVRVERRLWTYVRFIRWLMLEYIFVVMRTFLFVTKRLDNRKIVFYLKSVWFPLMESTFQRKYAKKCELLPEAAARRIARSSLKTGVLHYYLKGEKLRPIVKNKRDKLCKLSKKDELLKISREFLNTLYQKVRANSGVLETGDLHVLRRARCELWKDKKVHVVRVDVKDAFGSVKHDFMRAILIELFEKFYTQEIRMKKKKKKYLFEAFHDAEFQACHSQIQVISQEFLLGFILRQLESQFVKFDGKWYHLREGVAQGAPLSPALFNIYINHFDVVRLRQFCCEDALLFRKVDDYLYVTTESKAASRFLYLMRKGTAPFFVINDKTVTSDTVQQISYYGFTLNTETLASV